MTSTSSRFADYQSRSDKAVGHVLVDGHYQARYTRDADAQSPAGGVSASVNDLTHWDGDVFTFPLQGENAPPGTISKATFAGDRLVLEYFDQDKMGTFTR